VNHKKGFNEKKFRQYG